MDDAELLALASVFDWGRIYLDGEGAIDLRVCRRGMSARGERPTWAVCDGSIAVLDVDGAWVHEPSPSSRDEAFLARTRFTRERAIELACAIYARRYAP